MRKVYENRFSEKLSHNYAHFHVATPSDKPDLVCFMFYFVATATEYPNWVINTTLDFRSLTVVYTSQEDQLHSPATLTRVTTQCHIHT